jgi:hypothetical protein
MGKVDHGPRLSDEEYEKRIFAIYDALPPMPSREAERDVRRRELDVLIDHRLGVRFPSERRDALWHAQEQIEQRRSRIGIETLARALLPSKLHSRTSGLARFAVNQYAKVLNSEELERFLGDEPIRRQSTR